ncbi:MAG: histidine phosphatase family protein [Gammaproteobacteria bacterium]|nr:histidine phosphatase family protein [Gammaproteobacteria bacterium]
MVNKLILMRHAKSDWNADYRHDFERPLNRRGRKDTTRMGKWLKQSGLGPDGLISSPAVRAFQTAERVAEVLGYSRESIVPVDSLYEADLETAFGVVQQAVNDYVCPLIIAHNPALDTLVNYLASQSPATTASGKLMTTAAIAVFSVGGRIERGGCELAGLVRPKEID